LVLGLVSYFMFRLAQERNHASREAAIATAMNRFLADDLLAQTNPYQSGNAKEFFSDVIDRASSNIDRQFRAEPLTAALLHQTVAKAFDGRSDYARARREYDRANDLFLQAKGPLSQDAVLARLQRADMEARSGDPTSFVLAESGVKDAEAVISRIAQPDAELAVRVLSTRGLIALMRNDPRSAHENFGNAVRKAEAIPSFDQTALLKLKQRLAFSYLRLGDGAKAETLFRELIEASSKTAGAEDLNALPFHVNLSQALLVERKYAEAIKEADVIYPILVAKLGEDHEASMKVLGTRAAAEGSLGKWDDAIRDDLTAHELVARKQGPNSLFSISTLSDAALSQCRAGRYMEGIFNSRMAFEEAKSSFGANAGLTGGCSYALAICLMGNNQLNEAADLLDNIDAAAVTQLTGDFTVSAEVALAKGEFAVRRKNYLLANRYLQEAAPTFELPDANGMDKQTFQKLREVIDSHARAQM
jgi:hypothetical protein